MLRPVDLLDSVYQPKGRSERDIDELAQSIKTHGILAPLVVRRTIDGDTSVNGHRRKRAAIKAGLEFVPCIIREMSDTEEAVLVLVENGKRLDLTPLEEAEIIAGLKSRGMTEEQIADKISKPIPHVRRRLLLVGLSVDARAALVAGKITTFAAEQIARLELEADRADALERLIGDPKDPLGRRFVLQVIQGYERPLSTAPWSLVDESLPGGACSKCPKRSSAQASLFGEADEADRCLDGACWEGKEDEIDKRRFDAAKKPDASAPATWKAIDESDPRSARDEEEEQEADERSAAPSPPRKFTDREIEGKAAGLAVDLAIEAIVAKCEKTKTLDEKAMRHVAALLINGADDIQIDEVCERRGLLPKRPENQRWQGRGDKARAALLELTKKASIGQLFGLVEEIAIVTDLNFPPSGNDRDDTALALACRFADVDLEELREDALKVIKREVEAAKKKASKPASEAAPADLGTPEELSIDCKDCGAKKGKPCVTLGSRKEPRAPHAPRRKHAEALLEEKASPKASASKKGGKTKADTLLEDADTKLAASDDGKAKTAEDSARATTDTKALEKGDRVKINGGDHRGRVGVIKKIPKPPFADHAMVLFDRQGKERTDKEKMVALVHLELDASSTPEQEPASQAIELTVACSQCKVAAGVVCKKDGGGFHVQRTRAAVELRDGTGRLDPLKVDCSLCGATPGKPCIDGLRATKPHQARIDAAAGSGNSTPGGLPEASKELSKKPKPAGNPEPTTGPACRFCGCTEEKPCEACGDWRGLLSAEKIECCAGCADLIDTIKDELSDGPRDEIELQKELLEDESLEHATMMKVIEELVKTGRTPRLPGGRIGLQERLPLGKPLEDAEQKPAGQPAKRGRGRPPGSKNTPKEGAK